MNNGIRLSTSLACMLILISAYAQETPEIIWQKAIGGSDHDQSGWVTATPDGGCITGGNATSNDGDVISSYEGADCWVVKFDQQGNIEWANTYGGSSSDQAVSLTLASTNGYAFVGGSASDDGDATEGHGTTDVWVVRIDSLGSILWQRSLGGSDPDFGNSIIQTTAGGFAITGSSSSNDGNVSGNHGSRDAWVCTLDSLGNIIWQDSFGGSDWDVGNSIIQTDDGGFLISGNTKSNDGDVTGFHGNRDAWLLKLDSLGELIWQKALGGSNEEYFYSSLQSEDGSFISVGSTSSNDGDVTTNQGWKDYWITKVDIAGNLIWQNTIGGTETDRATSLQFTNDGGYYVAGNSSSYDGDIDAIGHGNSDIWIIRLDSLRNIVWQALLGGSSGEPSAEISIGSSGEIFVAGDTGSNDGDVTGTHGTYSDIWVIKLTEFYTTMSGSIYADMNSNSIQDPGESGVHSHGIQNQLNGQLFFSQSTGQFMVNCADTGSAVLTPHPLTYYNAVPATHTLYIDSLFSQIDSLNDFAMQPQGAYNDLEVSLNPVSFFRPGFPCYYSIGYKNVGTTSLSPEIVIIPDEELSFDSSSVDPFQILADTIYWQLPLLAPMEEGSINCYFTLDVNATLGDSLYSTAKILPEIGDANGTNNTSDWPVVIQGSYDPNDILVDRASLFMSELAPEPPYLDYIIRFQNVGSDTAFTVRIENELPEFLDISSLQLHSSSHSFTPNYHGLTRRLELLFNDIQLPDDNNDYLGSNGFVRYKLRPLSTLTVGEEILNQADIFFDYNAPVSTNTAVTTIELSTGIVEASGAVHDIYPNPFNNEIRIDGASGPIELYDLTGRLMRSSNSNHLNGLEELQRAVYIVKSGQYFFRVVKQ